MKSECIVLYNPKSADGNGESKVQDLQQKLSAPAVFKDITKIDDMASFVRSVGGDTDIILTGGDGTLNRFVNDIGDMEIKNDIYYYATGTGNDFWRDIGCKPGDAPALINQYIKNLPEVEVNGVRKKFINGIGYGIDGYCCEKGDELRGTGKNINYAAIAIKGMLFSYKPKPCTVTVDGKEYRYLKAWLVPTMLGKYYGGGMMPAPKQSRLSSDGSLSVMAMFGCGMLKALIMFPGLFSGEHVKHVKNVNVLTGKKITVSFDEPTPLQIDGETIKNVKEYTVYAGTLTAANKIFA